MTCQSCRYQWCWICNQKYSGSHYKYWNPFSCVGEQYDDSGKCVLLLKALLKFLVFPFILLFGPIFLLPAMTQEKCFSQYGAFCRNTPCLVQVFAWLLMMPLALGIGAVGGVLALGLLIVPVYLVLLYRITIMIFGGCCVK